MSQSNTPATKKPTTLGSFLRGFRTGAINSSIMMGIFYGISLAFHMTPLGLGAMGAATLATALFSGVMGIKKAKEPTPQTIIPQARTLMVIPDISPSLNIEQSQEAGLRTNWAERTGRSGDTQSRVEQILSNGSLSDKDRASAILSAREAAASKSTSIV